MPEPRNPLEVVEEALAEADEELISTFHALSDEQQQEYGPVHAMVVGRTHAALTLLRKLRADAVVGWIVAEVASTGASDDVWEMRVIVPDGEHEDEGDEVALLMPFTDTETAK
jgi:hypothetical protein